MTSAAQRAEVRAEDVLALWCEYTQTDQALLDVGDRTAFLRRPQVPALAATPVDVLRDAAQQIRRGRSLPLERWLAGVRVIRPPRDMG
jgi:hypothetical protein